MKTYIFKLTDGNGEMIVEGQGNFTDERDLKIWAAQFGYGEPNTHLAFEQVDGVE